MPRSVIVLDINGVLADVRKLSEKVPRDMSPDLRIPSGQRVYIRKNMADFAKFIDGCRDEKGWIIAMWTSRKRENAEPIEEHLRRVYGLRADHYFHGEDCMSMVGCHPVKESRIIRKKLGLGKDDIIVFFDDSPERIKMDTNSGTSLVHSYDAITSIPPDDDMSVVSERISRFFKYSFFG